MCREALGWLVCQVKETDQFCFKSTQMRIQRGMKAHSDKGRESAMKEIKNLTIKNPCFGKINIELETREIKEKALPLLIFMVNKRNGGLKTRGVANGSYQRM